MLTEREKALFMLGYSQGNQGTVMQLMLILGIGADSLEFWHKDITELKEEIIAKTKNK